MDAVETAYFGNLHLRAESLRQVVHDYPISRHKECKDHRQEAALVPVEFGAPVIMVCRKIDVFRSPDRPIRILVGSPDLNA